MMVLDIIRSLIKEFIFVAVVMILCNLSLPMLRGLYDGLMSLNDEDY